MKKKIVLILLTVLLVAYNGFGQNVFYDALVLRQNIVNDTVFKKNTLAIFAQYFGKNLDITALKNDEQAYIRNFNLEFQANPFLKRFKIQEGGIKGEISFASSGQFLSSAGNLNVTNFADGLAKFLVARSKEELNVAFFSKFKDYLNKYTEVQIIFPTTYNFLDQIYSYQYAAMLPALKSAFQKDFNAFGKNLLNLREKSNYTINPSNEKRVDAIIRFLNTPDGRAMLGSIIVAKGIVKGNNAADIIANLANDDICKKFPNDNFSNTMQFVDLVSQSLRSTADGRVWITKDQITNLVSDEITFKIYLGLIYAQSLKKSAPIHFTSGNYTIHLKEIFEKLNENWKTDSGQFIESYREMANAMSEVTDNAKIVNDSKKQGDQPSILVFADYTASISNLLKLSVNFLPKNNGINPALSGLTVDLKKFTDIIDDATDACYDIKSQNYSALVLHISSVLSEITPADDHFRQDFVKYGIFMANIVEAKNSDEVQTAIEAAVLPVGSSSVKRETDMNISLNAYIGPYAGIEYLPKLKQNQWAKTVGLTAPVGIAFSWGKIGMDKKRCCGNEVSGGKSYTLFVPVIDVGSIASFRMANDSSKVASDITLSNIISPGLFFYYGFGKCPISIGFGGQLGPQLRGVTAKDLNIDKNYYLRFGFNVVVDIPFFNLYTKN